MNRRGSYRGGIIAWDPQLGRAFEHASQPDSAIVTYERYLETGSLDRLGGWDWYHRGGSLERLGTSVPKPFRLGDQHDPAAV